ncbi:MAG: tetratricopeptide repeat protein [Synechococcaceae cyanobacterium SM1_2_3]|nr:tetratricopeptide repeat protein [Synechococcaceae cyanobacterium SM1_2_3]
MEQYTDDERVENLKAWVKESGASIGVGIALGVIALFGWRAWVDYQNARMELASHAYDAFIEAVAKPDARERGQKVLTDFPQSPYAALAALRLAQLALDSGDAATAIQRLEWVISNAQLDELRDIARLRLARAQWAAGQLESAQKLLDSVTTATLNAERDELKGDLHLARNETAKARSAYAAALAASGGNRLVQWKLDQLAGPTPDALLIPAPAPLPEPQPVKSESAETAPVPARADEPATESVPAVELTPVVEAAPVAELAPAKELEPMPVVEPAPVTAESAQVAPNPLAEPAAAPVAHPDDAVPASSPLPATPGQ